MSETPVNDNLGSRIDFLVKSNGTMKVSNTDQKRVHSSKRSNTGSNLAPIKSTSMIALSQRVHPKSSILENSQMSGMNSGNNK